MEFDTARAGWWLQGFVSNSACRGTQHYPMVIDHGDLCDCTDGGAARLYRIRRAQNTWVQGSGRRGRDHGEHAVPVCRAPGAGTSEYHHDPDGRRGVPLCVVDTDLQRTTAEAVAHEAPGVVRVVNSMGLSNTL